MHGITDMLKRLRELTPPSINFDQEPVQMFIYGSYSDDQGFGEEIIEMVLGKLKKNLNCFCFKKS